MAATEIGAPGARGAMVKVIAASTLGTLFEWYDFFLFSSLASVISSHFFNGVSENFAFILALLAFGVGFAFRPLGALIFGRLGDLMGRKSTFLLTLLFVGGSTFLVGVLPTYDDWGVAAPIILVLLRILQGIGVGGEYGGAAVFVAEQAPPGKRGAYTSWIQMAGIGAIIMSLLTVAACQSIFGASFQKWAWRVPFLLSGILLVISFYVRLSLSESPMFLKMKAEGTTSHAPIAEVFGQWRNLKTVLIALFGLVTGVTTVIYTAQIYAFFFLSHILRVDSQTTNVYVAATSMASIPFFWFFGWLSDKIGGKRLILFGCFIAAITYFPIFHAITHYANPSLEAAISSSPVTVRADPKTCSFQFSLISGNKFNSDCDVEKSFLAKKGIPYTNEAGDLGSMAEIRVGDKNFSKNDLPAITRALSEAGYRDTADANQINKPMLILMLFILVIYLAMVYAPLASTLVEMFPARIRYTALSFPYQLGNGLVGGFFPAISFAMIAESGNIYAGLWYPIAFIALAVVVGGIFLKRDRQTGPQIDVQLPCADTVK